MVDWNPRYVFHEYFDNNEDMEWFFENICTNEWNLNQDKGYSMKIATEEKISEFPKYKNLISQYYGRWEEMLKTYLQNARSNYFLLFYFSIIF